MSQSKQSRQLQEVIPEFNVARLVGFKIGPLQHVRRSGLCDRWPKSIYEIILTSSIVICFIISQILNLVLLLSQTKDHFTMAPHRDSESMASRPVLAPQPVKTFDAGTVDGNVYGAISGFAKRTAPGREEVLANAFSVPPERRKRLIIVGAGVSGIQQASTLLKQKVLKHGDMQIFDAQSNYGGVWEKNDYPGCACDVPSMIYTTSYYIWKCRFKIHKDQKP